MRQVVRVVATTGTIGLRLLLLLFAGLLLLVLLMSARGAAQAQSLEVSADPTESLTQAAGGAVEETTRTASGAAESATRTASGAAESTTRTASGAAEEAVAPPTRTAEEAVAPLTRTAEEAVAPLTRTAEEAVAPLTRTARNAVNSLSQTAGSTGPEAPTFVLLNDTRISAGLAEGLRGNTPSMIAPLRHEVTGRSPPSLTYLLGTVSPAALPSNISSTRLTVGGSSSPDPPARSNPSGFLSAGSLVQGPGGAPNMLIFGAFLTLLTLVAPGLSRWLRLLPALRRPPAFVSLVERPG